MKESDLTILDNPTPRRPTSKVRRLVLHALRVSFLLAVVLLIRQQHVRLEAERTASTAGTIPLESVTAVVPEATRVSEFDSTFGGHLVYDAQNNPLGYAMQTSPECDQIVGYSGPTNLLLVLDLNNKIKGISVLRSQDTVEHINAVINHASFFQQFQGVDRNDHAALIEVDSVSGATLTSYAVIQTIAFKLGGESPNFKFPKEITLKDATRFFKQASSVKPAVNDPRFYEAFDENNQLLGTLWRTSPLADHVTGYQGPTDALVAMDNQQQVIGIAVRESFDNDPYVGYLNQDYSFPEILNKYNLDQLSEETLESSKIEGVSGATMTSQAMIDAILQSAKALKEPIQAKTPPAWFITTRDCGTLLFLIAGCVIGFTNLRGRKRVRIVFQFLLVAYLGFINGDFVSQELLVGYAQNGIPLHHSVGLALLSIAALCIPIFTKKQIYCHQICPHGAAQFLIKQVSPWKYKLPRYMKIMLACVIPVLWLVIILTAMQKIQFNLVALEPFDAYLFQVAGFATISVALVGLAFSAFVPMGYCKYGCPTGSLLNFLRYQSKSGEWSHRDSFAVLLVLMAVICFVV
ncbi:MAG: hypothetical protein COA78_33230 [Blastopirellula sp.]|nr:MAG: hypothetical protein COA78_33230 [Blastopirellula sp.]